MAGGARSDHAGRETVATLERGAMDIRFECIYQGKRLFQVYREADWPLFLGTFPQCRRFIEVYNEKVLRSRNRDRRRRLIVELPQAAS